MNTITIKGIASDSKIVELQEMLIKIQEVRQFVYKDLASFNRQNPECVEYMESISSAESETSKLILSLTSAIGQLTAYDLADIYFEAIG